MATISAGIIAALGGGVDPGLGNWPFSYFNDEMGSAVDRTSAERFRTGVVHLVYGPAAVPR